MLNIAVTVIQSASSHM